MASRDPLQEFLEEGSPVLRELKELRQRGWANKDSDEFFRQRRERDENNVNRGVYFFRTTQDIAEELHASSDVFDIQGDPPRVLDLCMAPGGSTSTLLKHCPSAHVSGISLGVEAGGIPLRVWTVLPKDAPVEVTEMDITMLCSEFGVENIPDDHPDVDNFLRGQRPYQDKSFELVICHGQVLRTHDRPAYRADNEALRLVCSQLILALQRIRSGGTLVMLLHKAEARDTFTLLSQFHGFAKIQLFKPRRRHSKSNSFYLIATDVDPSHPAARDAVASWKSQWEEATFDWKSQIHPQPTLEPGPVSKNSEKTNEASDSHHQQELEPEQDKEIQQLLNSFGPILIGLAEPIWAAQRNALRNAFFTRPTE